MKEKKQTNRLSYSDFGKFFRGLLCMVTFGVFCASSMLTIYALENYGDRIITNPADHYTDTSRYEVDVIDEINHILYNINQIEESNVSEGNVSVLNMSEESVHYYDIEALYNDEFYPNNIENLSAYEKSEPLSLEGKDLMSYDQMKEYLMADDLSFEYIYFDESSFIELFKRDGLQNTDCRFSEEFSEDAYFIFENYEVTKKQKVLDTEEVTESTEQNVESTTEEISSETNAEVTKESAKTEETTEYELEISVGSDGKVVKETIVETEEVIITPYNFTSYAVYEPEDKLFYSTWDNYFRDIASYIYRAQELRLFIETAEKEGIYYNSIIMPLLKSYNMQINEVMNEEYVPYSNMGGAKGELQFCEDAGIYYCVKMGESIAYSNVKSEQDIEKMKRFYRIEKIENNEFKQTHSNNLKDLDDLNLLLDAMSTYPVGTVLWLGIESTNDNITSLAQRVEGYYWFANNSLILVIVVALSFILLMMQAVWLICTTGRKYKGDTEVELSFFDRWYTDIWAVVTVAILLVCIAGGLLILESVIYECTKEMMCFYSIVGMLPFGFCFMILTLSFARRIKAHNIWNRLLIVEFVKYIDKTIQNGKEDKKDNEQEGKTNKKSSVIVEKLSQAWRRCKEAYYNIKGTRKLLIIFVIYIILELIIVVVMMDHVYARGQCMLAFCALQIIALFLVVRVVKDIDKLTDGVKEITQGNLDSKVEINEKLSVFDDLANGINHIGDGLKNAVETSLKDERMKTELITNVSHDLKTPLTSIINYVSLLKKQDMPNEDAKHYVEVLDGKAQRLKQLTEDLVEAAKATSGNIELEMMPLTFDELMKQALGEFEDKFEKRNLTIIANYPEKPAVVMADGRRLFRIIENVLQNIYKYAMEGTRVYADLERDGDKIVFTLKNVSAAPLNISPDELMERFTRGDSSRTTEGSGLGLSIAKDLTRLQNGEFEIQLDGDLFKVIIRFPEHK